MAVGIPGQRGPRGPAFLLLSHLSSRSWGTRVGAAGEGGHEAEAEASVHEAVDDGVDARGGVGQQEDEGNGGPREAALGRGRVIGPPGVGAEDGHPAQEEKEHDDHEHADHPLLGHEVGRGAAAPDAVDPGAAGAGQLLKLQLPAGLGLLQVTAVAVLAPAAAAGARLPVCVGKGHTYCWGWVMPDRRPLHQGDQAKLELKQRQGSLGLRWQGSVSSTAVLSFKWKAT